MAKGFFFFVLLLLLGIAVTVYTQKQTAPPAKAVSLDTNIAPTSPAKAASTTQVSEVHASNSDKKIIMRATKAQDASTTYAFYIADLTGTNERLLYAKTLPAGASMSLPVNSWDPTDTYVFLEQKIGNTLTYDVMRTNGEAFADGNKFIDVGAVWQKKDPGYHIRTATGWASGTLLIIYTSKDDGSRGPAFWFEIPSTAIIQLAG